MIEQITHGFDIPVFYLINNKFKNDLLNILMPFITELGGVYFIVALGLSMLMIRKKEIRATGFLVLSGLAISETLSRILKDVFLRPRPAAIIENINILCHKSYTHSFPSGHATLAFTIAAIIASLHPRFSAVAYISAIIVGISRIYVGAHFPTDVLAGAVLGAIIGKMITYLWRQSFSRLPLATRS